MKYQSNPSIAVLELEDDNLFYVADDEYILYVLRALASTKETTGGTRTSNAAATRAIVNGSIGDAFDTRSQVEIVHPYTNDHALISHMKMRKQNFWKQ